MIINNLPCCCPHGQFIKPGPFDMAAYAEYLRTRTFFRADGSKPLRPPVYYMGDTCKGFYIIYDCGLAVEPHLRRERRLDTRLPPLSFYGLKECCLFAAYISACPLVDIYVTVKTRIEDIFPEIAPLVCLVNCLLKPVGPKSKLTSDVYIRC